MASLVICTDTNLPILLYHIRQKLLDDTVFTESQVYLGSKPELKVPPSTAFCVIRPLVQGVINDEITVSSRSTPAMSGDFELNVWKFFYTDTADRQTNQLTQQTLGIYNTINKINQSLMLTMLVDNLDNILIEPMRLKRIESPIWDESWLKICLIYNCKYGYDPLAYSAVVADFGEFDYEYNCDYNTTNIKNNLC